MQLINSQVMRFVIAFTKALECTSSFSSFDRVKYIRSHAEHDQSYRNNTTTVSEGIEEQPNTMESARCCFTSRYNVAL